MTDEPTPAPIDESESQIPAPVVAAPKKKSSVVNPYTWGTGRRKAAVARVRIKPGTGAFTVNKRDVEVFFCLKLEQAKPELNAGGMKGMRT